MAANAPPSYASVVAGLDTKLAGSGPGELKHVADVIASVPNDQKQVLMANISTNNVTLTDEQQKKMGGAMIDAAHSEVVAQAMKTSATDATKAINEIEAMFSKVLKELSTIDSKYPDAKPADGTFVEQLRKIHIAFRKTVQESKDLAVEIAVYGETFDDIIIPVVLDTTVSLSTKLAKLEKFIKRSEEFKTKSGDINVRYQSLKNDMVVFVGKFSSFATDKEGHINTAIDNLRKDLSALNDEIREKRTAMIVLGSISAASLPATAVIAACSGPFAPAVIVVGLITAGVTAITAVALAFAISNLQNRADAKTAEIQTLLNQVADIKNTRAKLELLGNNDLAVFKDKVDVLATFWTAATADAHKIRTFLANGAADDIEEPEILKKSADKAINIYKVMSQYLTAYAKGVDDSVLPKPNT